MHACMRQKLSTNLIGKAGVGLATYHLARLGFDFTVTTMNSLDGDLWVRFEGGLEMVEVKSSLAAAWHLRAEQLDRVSRVVFVLVDDACCWCLPVAPLRAFVAERGGKHAVITQKQLAKLRPEEWHKATPRPAPLVVRARKAARMVPGAKGNRVVIRTLADGTVKRYEYAPYNS